MCVCMSNLPIPRLLFIQVFCGELTESTTIACRSTNNNSHQSSHWNSSYCTLLYCGLLVYVFYTISISGRCVSKKFIHTENNIMCICIYKNLKFITVN